MSTAASAFAADPTTADCLAANDKSIALRNQHKLRAARSELLVCATASCPADIRNECTRRVGEVNAAMPTIVFEAKDASGNDLSAVKVTMDGQTLADRLEGTALSIDPGEHSFVFETPGQPAVTRQFVILEASKDRRERILLGISEPPKNSNTAVLESIPARADLPAPVSAPPIVSPAGSESFAPPQAPPVSTPAPDRHSTGSTQGIIGWSTAGIGVVGLGLGVLFEVQRSGKLSDRDGICPTRINCPTGSQARINSLTDDAKTASTVGAVSLVAGSLLVAGGLALVFTAPKASDASQVAISPIVVPWFQGVKVTAHAW